MTKSILLPALFAFGVLQAQTASDALMVVAHGAPKGEWNERVSRMVDQVEWGGPKAAAFLTPRTPAESLAEVAAHLDATGVKRIILVPLLISSYSDHYEEIRYYARVRRDEPEHVHGKPLETRAEIVVTPAMDDHILLGRILAGSLKKASGDVKGESVMLVAHGPNDDEDNRKWLEKLHTQAAYLRGTLGFRKVEAATIRDDAPDRVKAAAVADLRQRIETLSTDSRVLVQPVLISQGHVQAEIEKLLDGLSYRMSHSGVTGDALAAEWVRRQAETVSTQSEPRP